MSRPRKCRKVCRLPDNDGFLPIRGGEEQEPIILNVDEYEAIRLIDREGFSQEQCGEYMHIARTTVQQIYSSARKKLADALVEGTPIHISGGDYKLCDGNESYCGCGGCHRHRREQISQQMVYEEQQRTGQTPTGFTDTLAAENPPSLMGPGRETAEQKWSGEKNMKIAIPLDENKNDVCPVLARAPYFLFWEDGKQTVAENPATDAQGGAGVQAAQFLVDNQVTVLVTPRCGQNAADVFTAADMKIYKSANKAAADDLAACLDGKLDILTHFHGGFHGIR